MALERWEWCLRVGIPPTLLDRTPDPELGLVRLRELVVWRYGLTVNERGSWSDDVSSRSRSGNPGERTYFHELLNKKIGLFGWKLFGPSAGTAVDYPMDLARHPWALKEHEFAQAYAAVMDGDMPTAIPDDRAHVSAVLQGAGSAAVLAAAGMKQGSNPRVLVLSGLLLTAGGVAGAVGTVAGKTADWADGIEWDRLKRNIDGLQATYRREDDYRRRERT